MLGTRIVRDKKNGNLYLAFDEDGGSSVKIIAKVMDEESAVVLVEQSIFAQAMEIKFDRYLARRYISRERINKEIDNVLDVDIKTGKLYWPKDKQS